MDIYIKRQAFSELHGSDSNKSDVGSGEVLAAKRSQSKFVWK